MAQQESKITLSKKGKREVSPFIGHELLYDYLTGSLDPERQKSVEDHVRFSRDAQLDLNKIENGQSYAGKLAATRVSAPILDQINAPSTYLTVLMQKSKFEKWPMGLKWGLEALAVVAVIVVFLIVVPWQKVIEMGITSGSKEVILAEATKEEKPDAKKQPEQPPQFVDEGIKGATPAAATAATKPAAETANAKTATAVAAASATTAKTQTADAGKKPTPAAPAKVAAAAPAVDTKKDEAKHGDAAASGGFLYRGGIAVTNLEVVGPKITDKIIELGGRKAGEVELGWSKTPGSAYYHFTIPEAKYQELTTFLEQYGTPKIGKEKHPRVMPDGIIRLIITVDEAKK
jgi:hypothetical protein